MEACGANIVLTGNDKRETHFSLGYFEKEINIHGNRNALKDDFINNIDLVAQGKCDGVL